MRSTYGYSSNLKKSLGLFVVVLLCVASLSAQVRQNRIFQAMAARPSVELPGSVHPLARRAADFGSVDSSMQLTGMTLNIAPSATQKQEIASLLSAQQDSNSAQYHKWLTQEQYGALFGLSDSDLNQLTSWLKAQGFTVKAVSTSLNSVSFSGAAFQVESAFKTQLHHYKVNGEIRYANKTAVNIPAQFSGVVQSVGGLENFRLIHHLKVDATPDYTPNGLSNYLTPADWATIYNVNALYAANLDGAGMRVGIVGETYVPQSDIDNFRAAAGLSATKIRYVCISSVDCTDAAGISSYDLPEADLDIEWAGGIAKNATVDYIYSSGSDNSNSVISALEYAVRTYKTPEGTVLPVISMSYGTCETPGSGASNYYSTMDALGQQANLQGQTLLVASGDSGAACSDVAGDSSHATATGGAMAGWPGSSSNFTAVGGTTLSGDLSGNAALYWNETGGVISNALGYIPETPWSQSTANGIAASGGGMSSLEPLPTWQVGLIQGVTGRMTPDLAFTASSGHDGYAFCNPHYNACEPGNGFYTSANTINSAGGTSAASPSFAGMLTLLVQKYGPLGNINPKLYSLAQSNPSVFHDVSTGNTNVPCQTGTTGCVSGFVGYSATVGYDMATGLGSIDGGALYSVLTSVETTTTTASTSETSAGLGTALTLSASVASSGAGTPSGSILFYNGSKLLGTATLSNSTGTLNNVVANAENGFVSGANTIKANYSGDANFGPSTGLISVAVTLSTPIVSVTVSPNPLVLSGNATMTATITPNTATGTVVFYAGSTPIATLNVVSGTPTVESVAVTSTNGFTVGSTSISVQYSGDSNFAASTYSGSVQVVSNATATTTAVSASPSSVTLGASTTLTATVTPSNATGRVSFTIGNQLLGTVVVSNGTAQLSLAALTTTGFSIGANAITATFVGNPSTYSGSSNTTSVTVTTTSPGSTATTTALLASPNPVALNANTMLTATVTPSIATGNVSFTIGSKSLGTATVESGVAQLNLAATTANGLLIGANAITATFVGNSSTFATSSITATVTVPPYSVSANSASMSLAPGGGTSLTLTLISQVYSGPVSFTTSVTSSNGAAADVTAGASPVNLTAGTSGTTTLTVTANSSAANHGPAFPWKGSGALMLGAVLLGAPFTLRRKQMALGLLMISLALLVGCVACGGSGNGTTTSPAQPTQPTARTYTVLVTPVGSGSVVNPSPVSVVLTVQ